MTDKERKLALYCLKSSSDYHSEVCEECMNYPNCDHTWQDDVTETIIKALEQEPKWVPVSERLPKEHLCDDGYVEPSDYVLVWGDHGNYGVSRYWGNRRSKSESPNTHKDWVDLDWVAQEPIAWMPLPEPYKAERKEVNDRP